jgi:DnaJ-class molecular chaperone
MGNPFQDLDLEQDASASEVEEAWRRLRTKLHPDHGGNSDEFDKVRKSYLEALKIAAEPKPCLVCKGKGRIKKMKGFVTATEFCPDCGGSGKRK